MAANITKISSLRTVAGRTFASSCQAAPAAPVSGTTNYNVTNTKVNGINVVSAENKGAVTRISVVFRAGSRQEQSDNAGVAHVLRICAGLSTKNATNFAITRRIQQVGASLHCTQDRETISYTLEGTKDAINEVLPLLTEVASAQVFQPWEVSDNVNRIRLELATRPPALRAIDLLHKAAYRGVGLGNSLFIPKYNLGKIGSETLAHFVNSNFRADKCSVVGLGVNHKDLEELAKELKLQSGGQAVNPSPYKGGEIRSDKGGNLAYVAVAGEGVALKNHKESLTLSVLQKALGTGSRIKYATNDGGLLRTNVSASSDISISGLNVSYGDTGLFGAIFAAPAEEAGNVTKKVIETLKSGKISDELVNRAKNQVQAEILIASESGRSVVRKLGTSASLTGNGVSPTEYLSILSQITTSDVNNALTKIGSSKLSIASYGRLDNVPYLADL